VDSLGSDYALQHVFGGHIGVYDSPSTMASMLAERLKIDVVIAPDLSKYDIVVTVDTSTLVQTGYKSLGKCALIDHHTPGDLSEGCEIALARIGSSTAELVYDLYKKNGLPVDANIAFALVLAIITDTGHFRYAGAGTFEVVGKILAEGGIRYADVTDFLGQVPADISCRIAILKAASRLTLHRVKATCSSSNPRQLLRLAGGHVAHQPRRRHRFRGSEERERRISGRVRRGIDLDLARLLQDIGKKFSGSGVHGSRRVVIRGDLDESAGKMRRHGRRTDLNRPPKKGAR
jgi:hypothetical protein